MSMDGRIQLTVLKHSRMTVLETVAASGILCCYGLWTWVERC